MRGLALGVSGIVWFIAHGVIAPCTSRSSNVNNSSAYPSHTQEDYSATFAPLLLPALLALIGASQPPLRLSGLHVIGKLLETLPAFGAHLERAGLTPLILDHLQNSTTYLSNPLGAAMLFETVRIMSMLPGQGASTGWAAEAAFESIQRAWAYAPTSSIDPENAGGVAPELPPGVPIGEEQSDPLCATIEALCMLLAPAATKDKQSLTVSSVAKGLGATLEFLSAQLCFEPAAFGIKNSSAGPPSSYRLGILVRRVTCAAEAIQLLFAKTRRNALHGTAVLADEALLSSPPGLAAWTPRVLSSAARSWVCWTEIDCERDARLDAYREVALAQRNSFQALRRLVAEVQQSEPVISRKVSLCIPSLRSGQLKADHRLAACVGRIKCAQRLLDVAPECAGLWDS